MANFNAFPESQQDKPGLTYLDYVAVEAMGSILLSVGFDFHDVEVAHAAYRIASAMLNERAEWI